MKIKTVILIVLFIFIVGMVVGVADVSAGHTFKCGKYKSYVLKTGKYKRMKDVTFKSFDPYSDVSEGKLIYRMEHKGWVYDYSSFDECCFHRYRYYPVKMIVTVYDGDCFVQCCADGLVLVQRSVRI